MQSLLFSKGEYMDIGNHVYYCEVLPNVGVYEIIELIIRTVGDGYYVGVDEKTKQAQLFTTNMIDEYVFVSRADAIEALKIFRGKNDD